MKTDPTHAKEFASLYKQLKRKFKPAEITPAEPVTQLVIAYLEWNAGRRQAEQAHRQLMANLVDNNDLRVSHTHELVAMIGDDYPHVEQRATRLRETLQNIYVREHAVSLDSLRERPKKEARAYLDSLAAIPQYVAAQVTLLCFGGHAVPVDDKMASLLVEEGAVPAGASVQDIGSFLERQVKAGEGVELHQILRAWADSKRRKEMLPEPAGFRPAASTVTAAPATATRTRTRKAPVKKKK